MNKSIPEGFQSVTPSLNINGAAKALELYKKAFGAKELYCMSAPDGKIMHACIEIGNSKLFLADMMPDMKDEAPSNSTFYVYVGDVDAAYKQATDAGLKALYPLEDMFWGDRTGCVRDAFGVTWTLATHMREVSSQDLEEGKKQFLKKVA